MKKFLIIICIVFFCVSIFPGYVYAANNGKWFNPKYLRTYVQPGHKRTDMMKRAFAEWSRLTNNKFKFYFVNSPNVAQIEVYFVQSIPNADREIGLTRVRNMRNGKMTHAEILIAEKSSKGRVLGNDSVYTVMLHEIGHSIGIKEHSDEPLSIMYPIENDAQEILKSDLKKLYGIYGWD